jgi:uncharacterized protein YbbC (DUF1343 family)
LSVDKNELPVLNVDVDGIEKEEKMMLSGKKVGKITSTKKTG